MPSESGGASTRSCCPAVPALPQVRRAAGLGAAGLGAAGLGAAGLGWAGLGATHVEPEAAEPRGAGGAEPGRDP
jgi:hypothetical protein